MMALQAQILLKRSQRRETIHAEMRALAEHARPLHESCEACKARAPNPPPHACLVERKAYLASLSESDRAWAQQWWWSVANAGQIPPLGDWDVSLLLMGRGSGKTFTGAWQVIEHAWKYGAKARIGIVARTSAANDTVVITTGPSGILKISPKDFTPHWSSSRKTIVWPNGAQAFLFTAEEPNQLRGPEFTFVWVDELASWEKIGSDGVTPDAWDQLQLGLRSQDGPCQIVATTTPLPTEFIRKLKAEEGVVTTTGTMFSNAHNLSDKYIRKMIRKYEGTRLGRQELYGEILDDAPGALWSAAWFDVQGFRSAPPDTLTRVVVAIDPAVTSNPNSDETGIVVAGVDEDGFYWVLADYSGNYTAETWAAVAIQAYHRHEADVIVAEVNNGGDLVLRNIEACSEGEDITNFQQVRATRGKALRAEPIAALYERGLVRHSTHAPGGFEKLERQLTGWSPILALKSTKRDDRLDAVVWALTELIEGTEVEQGPGGVYGVSGNVDEMSIG
jgi:phage terminase large subunit-like protein